MGSGDPSCTPRTSAAPLAAGHQVPAAAPRRGPQRPPDMPNTPWDKPAPLLPFASEPPPSHSGPSGLSAVITEPGAPPSRPCVPAVPAQRLLHLLSPWSPKGPGRPRLVTSGPSVLPDLWPPGPTAQAKRENPKRYKSQSFSPFFFLSFKQNVFPAQNSGHRSPGGRRSAEPLPRSRQTRNDPKQTQKAAAAGETEPRLHGTGPSCSPSSTSGEGRPCGKPRKLSCQRQEPRRSPRGHTQEKQTFLGKESPSHTTGARTLSKPGGWAGLAGLRGRGGDTRPRLAPAGRKHPALGFWGTQVSLDSRGCWGRTEQQAPDWRDKCEFE